VLLGSRSAERAVEAAAKLRRRLMDAGREVPRIDDTRNCDAVPEADIVFLTCLPRRWRASSPNAVSSSTARSSSTS
jgi:predicted dinucleotide-binding enzyme